MLIVGETQVQHALAGLGLSHVTIVMPKIEQAVALKNHKKTSKETMRNKHR